ncbi:hypothetical protein JL107_14235 [Nakamurella flavida]|uniref:Uncharacterized protein n=1 Tax=Nakamurella flavida TaxID=363630 RepID=A0A938YH62_9ACTN|nr:hypothetical protein [Nakamurella flavida]MBM9477606.1 hypothetical protein [Nakamurella flavida]MDP9779154.1 hypothetical protein [Nakamurella flavida]
MSTTGEERTRAALDLLSDQPGPRSEDLRRDGTRRTRLFLWGSLVPLVVVGGLGGVLLARADERAGRWAHQPAPWQTTVGLIVAGLGVLIAVGGIMARAVSKRRHGAPPGWNSPLLALTSRERRRLNKQVMGQALIDMRTLPLARLLAHTVRHARFAAWSQVGLTVMFLGQMLLNASPLLWAVFGIGAVMTAVGAVAGLRHSALADRFLARHPSDDPPSTASADPA